jgi:hypothetical protein
MIVQEIAAVILEESFYGEVCPLYETDENGDEKYTEEAQELFDDYCSLVLKVLKRNGVKQHE